MDSSSSLGQQQPTFGSEANLLAEPMQSSSLANQLDQEMTNSSEFPAMLIGGHLHNGSTNAVDLPASSASSSASSTSSSDEHQQVGLEIMDTQKESPSGNPFNSYLYLLNNQQGSKSKLNNITNLTNPATTPHFSLNASTNPASELDELAPINHGNSSFNSPNSPLNPGAGSSASPEQLSNNGTAGLNNGQFTKGIPLF